MLRNYAVIEGKILAPVDEESFQQLDNHLVFASYNKLVIDYLVRTYITLSANGHVAHRKSFDLDIYFGSPINYKAMTKVRSFKGCMLLYELASAMPAIILHDDMPQIFTLPISFVEVLEVG